MLKDSHAFSSFSTNDIDAAKKFYGETLGLDVEIDKKMGFLTINLITGGSVLVYPKGEQHKPAEFTVLNFPVDNIDSSVDELIIKGITFEQYDNEYIKTNERGISRDPNGPQSAWFKDPAGNILSVLQIPNE